MTTSIYLVRHGEVHNPNGTLYGRLPRFGLSERGKREIGQTAEFLKDKKIDFIYASPLLRARQTAEIIRSKLHLPKVHISKSLLEVKTSFQGRLYTELSHDQSDIYLSPKRLATDETLEQIATRMQMFIDHITKRHPGKRIVVVSHGDPLMLLRAVLSGMPPVYQSVREGNGFSYLRHGEAIELVIDDKDQKTIKSIFQPLI